MHATASMATTMVSVISHKAQLEESFGFGEGFRQRITEFTIDVPGNLRSLCRLAMPITNTRYCWHAGEPAFHVSLRWFQETAADWCQCFCGCQMASTTNG